LVPSTPVAPTSTPTRVSTVGVPIYRCPTICLPNTGSGPDQGEPGIHKFSLPVTGFIIGLVLVITAILAGVVYLFRYHPAQD
jgi:hypothetical protein